MRKIAVLLLVVMLASTSSLAQEAEQAEDEQTQFVLLHYVAVKPGMEQAFLAAIRDHLEWHRSSGDDHYYNTAQIVTGPRTGQYVFSSGPMSGEMLDDYMGFMSSDIGDFAGRGGMMAVDSRL